MIYNKTKYPFDKKSFDRLQEHYKFLNLNEDKQKEILMKEKESLRCKRCKRIPTNYGLNERGLCNHCFK